MANANGAWVFRLAMGLAAAAILGGVGVYAQVRDNTSDLKTAKEVHKETRQELKQITSDVGAIRESMARQEGKQDAIYDAIVKDK